MAAVLYLWKMLPRFAFLVFLIPFSLWAGRDSIPAFRYFSIPVGVGYSRMLEERLSPLVYSGLQGQFTPTYEKIRKNRWQIYQLQAEAASLQNSISTPLMNSRMLFSRLEGSNAHLRMLTIPSITPLEIWLGASWNLQYLLRRHTAFYNNSTAYTWFTGLGFELRLRYPFQALGHQWVLLATSSVSGLGLLWRQPYGSYIGQEFLDPEQATVPAILKGVEAGLPSNFFQMRHGWQFRYLLRNGNYLCLGTQSAFTSARGIGKTRFRLAENSLVIGAGFQF